MLSFNYALWTICEIKTMWWMNKKKIKIKIIFHLFFKIWYAAVLANPKLTGP